MLKSLTNILRHPYPIEDIESYMAMVSSAIIEENLHTLIDEISDVPTLVVTVIQQMDLDLDEFMKHRVFTIDERDLIDWYFKRRHIDSSSVSVIELTMSWLLPLSHLLLEFVSWSTQMPLTTVVTSVETLHSALVARRKFDDGETDEVAVKIRCRKPNCSNTDFGGFLFGETFCGEHFSEARGLVSELQQTMSEASQMLETVRKDLSQFGTSLSDEQIATPEVKKRKSSRFLGRSR